MPCRSGSRIFSEELKGVRAAMLVEMNEIVRSFGDGEARVVACDGIDLTLEEGESIAIVGNSGSGKSTLLQILGCLDRPDSGTYLFAGRNVEEYSDHDLARIRNEEIGFVFQSFHLLPDRSALENVGLSLDYRRGEAPPESPETMLKRVGLGHRLTHLPSQLSGGERQRVAIARALVKSPRLLLCDEPTGNLDSTSSESVLNLLEELRRERSLTVVMVTHDRTVAESSDRILSLLDGRWAS